MLFLWSRKKKTKEEKEVEIDLRSFSEILAKRQGGVKLKPGRPVVLDMTAEEVRKVFGSIPAAVTAYGVTVMIRRIGNDSYKVKIKLED